MGPPPHNLVLEQLMDIAARGLGLDPAEIRRQELHSAGRLPVHHRERQRVRQRQLRRGARHRAGDGRLPAAARRAGAGTPAGALLGIGLVNTIEPGVFDWNAYAIVGMPQTGVPEGATVGIDIFGKIVAKVGFSLEGQGQYTVVAQVLAD